MIVKLEDIMPVSTRRRYTDAFKAAAVRLVSESGRPVAQLARELGIPDNGLYRWGRRPRQTHAQGTTPATLREEREALAALTRENLLLRQARDFSTRAAAGFARESP